MIASSNDHWCVYCGPSDPEYPDCIVAYLRMKSPYNLVTRIAQRLLGQYEFGCITAHTTNGRFYRFWPKARRDKETGQVHYWCREWLPVEPGDDCHFEPYQQ